MVFTQWGEGAGRGRVRDAGMDLVEAGRGAGKVTVRFAGGGEITRMAFPFMVGSASVTDVVVDGEPFAVRRDEVQVTVRDVR